MSYTWEAWYHLPGVTEYGRRMRCLLQDIEASIARLRRGVTTERDLREWSDLMSAMRDTQDALVARLHVERAKARADGSDAGP